MARQASCTIMELKYVCIKLIKIKINKKMRKISMKMVKKKIKSTKNKIKITLMDGKEVVKIYDV